MKNIISFTPLF